MPIGTVSVREKPPAQAVSTRRPMDTPMPRQPTLPSPILRARRDSARLLTPWLVRWLAFGALASLLSPALRGYNTYVGWLPFWLLVAPLLLLLLVHRHRLAAALSAILVGRRRRRSFLSAPQARRAIAATR